MGVCTISKWSFISTSVYQSYGWDIDAGMGCLQVFKCFKLGIHNVDFIQPIRITDVYLLLMADNDKITGHFTFFNLKKFFSSTLFKPEGIPQL